MSDKTAEAMAAALGVKLTTDDSGENTDGVDVNKEDTTNTDVDDGSEAKTDESGSADGTEKEVGEGEKGGTDDSSGGQEDDTTKSADHAESKTVIPDVGDSTKGTDQAADFDKILAERSGGRFKSLADIDKALEEAPQNAFANEQLAKINDYVKSGGSLQDYIKTQTVDYKSLSPIDLVKEIRALENPELSSEEIELLIEADYGVAEDAPDKLKKIAGAKLKLESTAALKKLQEHQQKWAVPHTEAQVDREKEIEKWEGQLGQAIDSVNEIVIPLNQTENFTFKLEQEAKAKIKSANREIDKFFTRYLKPDGTEDTAKFVREMAILDNFETIVRSAASSSKSQGKQAVVDDLKNPDFKGEGKKDTEDKTLTVAQQALRAFYNR